MKLLVVSQYYAPEPFKIADICEELVQRGHDVTVLTNRPNYPQGEIYPGFQDGSRDQEVLRGVKIMRVAGKPRGTGAFSLLMNYFSFMKKACRQIDYLGASFDKILVYQLSPVFMIHPAVNYKKKHGTKIHVYCLDLWPESVKALSNMVYRISKPVLLPYCRFLYRNCDAVHVTSPSFISYFQNVIGVKKEKLDCILQHGDELFLQVKQHTCKEKVLTYTGNIGKAQDFDTLLEAVTYLVQKKKKRDFKVLLIGDGSEKERLQNKIHDRLLDGYFICKEHMAKEELIPYYEQSTALFLTLKNDSLIGNTIPTKLQSYMAAGRPILGSCEGDAANLIERQRCGLVSRPKDGEDLGKNMYKILYDEESKYMGNRARMYFKEHFTLHHFIDEIESSLKRSELHV